MGSQRECTRILGPEGFRVKTIDWEAEGRRARILIRIERRGIRGFECSGSRRRVWRVRDTKERTWDDVPWAESFVPMEAHRDFRTRIDLHAQISLWTGTDLGDDTYRSDTDSIIKHDDLYDGLHGGC